MIYGHVITLWMCLLYMKRVGEGLSMKISRTIRSICQLAALTVAVASAHAEDSAPSCYLWAPNYHANLLVRKIRATNFGDTSYFSTIGWYGGANNGGGGYCGIQQQPGGAHNYIFSLWDSPAGAPSLVYQSPGSNVGRFGGEGTGLHYDTTAVTWSLNNWYTTAIRCWEVSSVTYYAFWTRDESTGTWTHHATYSMPTSGTYMDSFYAFLEDWSGSGHIVRRGEIKDSFTRDTSNAWHFQNTYNYTYNPPTGIYANATNGGMVNSTTAFFTSGGSTVNTVGTNANFNTTVSPAPTAPAYAPIQLTSSTVSYNSSTKILTLNWVTNTSTSPQYSYRIQIFNSSNTKVYEATTVSPHTRSKTVSVSSLPAGNYTAWVTPTDIFDQVLYGYGSSFTK